MCHMRSICQVDFQYKAMKGKNFYTYVLFILKIIYFNALNYFFYVTPHPVIFRECEEKEGGGEREASM